VNHDTHFNVDLKTNKAVFASLAERDGYFSFDLFEVDLTGMAFPFVK